MSEKPPEKAREKVGEKVPMGEPEFSRRVGAKAVRKLKAQRARAQGQATQTVWSGLGMIGLVGWGVAVPTLLGAALGVWLDQRYPMKHSWTLMLLFIGLIMGCVNAWHWVAREDQETHEKQEHPKNRGNDG